MNNQAATLPELPKGKLTIRHRQMRGCFQAYAGNTYLVGCSGGYPEGAAEELRTRYQLSPDLEVTIYGYKEPITMKLCDLREDDGAATVSTLPATK